MKMRKMMIREILDNKNLLRLRWCMRAITTLIVAFSAIWYLGNTYGQASRDITTTPLLKYNEQQLAQYDGNDPTKPVLLALDGYVYDVSSGRQDFYNPDKSYHYLVGKDSSSELHLFGGEIIKKKYQIVGVFQQ